MATTSVRRLRILIADTQPDDGQVFNDDEITEYLELYTDDPETAGLREVRLAAADALDAIAVSEVLTSKVVRTAAGISTDGAKVAAELRARAAALRDTVEREDLDAAEDATGGFAVFGYGRF